MIRNESFRVERSGAPSAGQILAAVERRLGPEALRWFISGADQHSLTVEATLADGLRPFEPELRAGPGAGKSAVISVIPTGVGCEFGGYAGDAAPVNRLLASCADYLVTNPNAVYASDFIGNIPNLLCTEGHCLDLFCLGRAELFVPRANRVGVVIEQAEPRKLALVFNVINAVRAVHGVEVVACEITEGPIGPRSARSRSGAYVGTVARPEVLLRACDRLVAQGATAIAVTSNILDLPGAEYLAHFEGRHPNPMGGVEAVMSHLVFNHCSLPAVHAPMTNLKDAGDRSAPGDAGRLELRDAVVDPRGAAELVSASGLACALLGASRAPQLGGPRSTRAADVVALGQVLAVVAPASTLGGIPTLAACRDGIPVIAVRENRTILDVDAARLGLRGVIEVDSYLEAAGVLIALRAGLALESLRRPLRALRG